MARKSGVPFGTRYQVWATLLPLVSSSEKAESHLSGGKEVKQAHIQTNIWENQCQLVLTDCCLESRHRKMNFSPVP